MTVVVVLLGGLVAFSSACGRSKKQKRRAATLSKLAKMDCADIAAKATRCDSAVRKAADAAQQKAGKKHVAMVITLGLTAFKSTSKCRKHVAQRIGFLRKSCKKYRSAADVCRKAQQRYFQGLTALRKCFALDDCDAIARCYAKRHVDTQM